MKDGSPRPATPWWSIGATRTFGSLSTRRQLSGKAGMALRIANWRRQRIGRMRRHTSSANARSWHTNGTETAKRRRCCDCVVMQITTTQNLVAVSPQVVKPDFFKSSRSAAAERLPGEAIRDLLKKGTIQKRKRAFEAQ